MFAQSVINQSKQNPNTQIFNIDHLYFNLYLQLFPDRIILSQKNI